MEKKNVLSRNLKLILILVFSMLFFIEISFADTPWWNTSFEFRQGINISTSAGSTPADYQIKLSLDNINVGANFNWSRDCEDIRILDNQTKLNYWTMNCDSGAQKATLWVKIPLSFTTTAKTLHIYYGNPSAVSESNGSNVFDFFDDFSGDLSKWTEHKNPDKIDIVDEYLQISGATTSAPYGHSAIGSDASYSGFLNGILEGELYLDTDAIAEMGFRGNYAANTGYKSRADARSGQGISHLKPPYNGWAFLGSCGVVGGGFPTHTWLPFSITVNGNTFTIVSNGNTQTCTDSSYNTAGEISLHNHYGLYSRYDTIRVRKYFASNINIVYGAEESLGLLDFSFITPASLSVGYIFKDDVYNVSVNVSCRKKASPYNCGDVNLSLRYNDTLTTFDNISISTDTPLWITSSLQSCSLSNGGSCIVSWLLNGTGNAGDSFLLDVFAISSEMFTFNQFSADNGFVTITNQPIVAFNSSVYDFGSFFKNSGDRTIERSVIADLGNSTNVTVSCDSGDCARFSDDFIDGIDMDDGDVASINFSCDDSVSGNFNAIFSVVSNENSLKSLINLSCIVEKIYGPLLPQLINPVVNTTISVMQNKTFKINATVTCVGECGEITAFALHNRSFETWRDTTYPFKQDITLTSATTIGAGYQTLLSFDSSNIGDNFDWSNNCNDIVFYTNYDELPFWVESCDSVGEKMKVWVKVDDEINLSGFDFVMYYGFVNTSKSNGNNVFSFFDDFNGGSLDLSKWNILYNQGWSVSGGELIGTNTNGILHSVNAFSGPIILESKTLLVSPAANGMMSLGFYSSATNGVGIMEANGAPSQYTYRNNGAWSGATIFDSLINYHLNRISIDASNNVALRIEDLTDGTLSTTSFTNTVNSEYIALGRKYDNANLNQGYNQRWDWIRTRMYASVEPVVTIDIEKALYVISNGAGTPFYTFDLQPLTCNVIEDGSCSFEWLVNATGPINTSHNVSVLFLSNYSSILSVTTNDAQVDIVRNTPPSITLFKPLNSSKIIGNGTMSFMFYVQDDSALLNCSLYLNGILNQSVNCSKGVNTTINLSLESGHYSWFVNVTDDDNNSVLSDVWDFYLIQNYSARVSKKITSENSGMYTIRNVVYNLVDMAIDFVILDFVDLSFNYGSFNVVQDITNVTNGAFFNGTVLGWDLSYVTNTSIERNYSIAGLGDYRLGDEFVVGLD